ncbi:MAG TPA: hypothetical protein VFQ23_23290 [Anaerolineales bacterium]|nr:hypothetical protein [Anaerolineales bacterium]
MAQVTSTVETNITPTKIATSIPTATAKLTCPKINSNIQFILPSDNVDLEISILNYLNEGGDPTKIEPKASESEIPPLYALSADIDGDLLSEVVISVGNFFGDPTIIHLYHCEQNDYQLAKAFTLDDISFAKPEFATKIFNTEPHFMILRSGYISGWRQDFLAVGWQNSEWRLIRLAAGTTPSVIVLLDQNADGTKEIFVKTRTAATPGGGISRIIIDSYSWNGNGFAFIKSDMPPGSDRVHYLDDAETAWRNGNPFLAISYYEIAARDPNLSSYWTTYELGTNQTELAAAYQKAFAFFRIVAIWFYLDRPDRASEYIQEMAETFREGKPGSEFVLAAKAISESYDKEPSFSKACSQAVNFLDTKYPDVVRNHLGDWGVANPIYSATSDICKFE